MSLLFWRKTKDTGAYRADGLATPVNVEVDENHPLPVQLIQPDDNEYPPVRIPEDSGYQAPIAGRAITKLYKLQGVTTGGAYTDGDAMGLPITLSGLFRSETCAGWVTGVFLIDKDDEGLQVDIPLFVAPFTATANDAAFAPSDEDIPKCRAVFQITEYSNWDANQFGESANNAKLIVGQDTNLYTQCVARGAINLAASSEPILGITVVPL